MDNENIETIKNRKGAMRSGLYMGLPFVLIALALFLISYGLYNGVIKQNGYFSLVFNDTAANNTDFYLDRSILDKIAPEPEDTDEKLNADDDDIVPPAVMPRFKYGQRWGTFNIPSFEYYNRMIFNCDNAAVFGNGVGRAFYGCLPGQGGNVVLCAHCTASFMFLEQLSVGDIIKIKTTYGVFEYEVINSAVFKPDDTSYVFKDYGVEVLVCYTCYPYRTTLPRTQRYQVTARKISGPDYTYDINTGNWNLVSGD